MGRKNRNAKKLTERKRKLARDSTKQKINNKQAAQEAYKHNQDIRDTWIEDVNLQFGGVINVPTKEKAINIATEASEADFDPSNRIFFTYGASVQDKKAQGEEVNNNELKRLAGAAVIYKQPSANNTHGTWRGKQWALGRCKTTSGADAEFVAISKCLSIAAKDFRQDQNKQTAPKITIFTHDQDATNKISRVRYIDSTKGFPEATPALLAIVKKSQSLRQSVGAVIELICIPRHTAVEGNRLAEAAARKAAEMCTEPSCTFTLRLLTNTSSPQKNQYTTVTNKRPLQLKK